MREKKTGWGQSMLFGLIMAPLILFCLFFVMGFLPDTLQHSIRQMLNEHLMLSSLLLYAASVWAFRCLNLDLRKKEDWPDN